MSLTIPSPQTVHAAAHRFRAQMEELVSRKLPARLISCWEKEWRSELEKILQESSKRPEVSIALVGGTGSGKSTLLNALIGARVLPISNQKACTSAPAVLCYGEGDGFEVAVDFIDPAAWQQEVSILLGDLGDVAVNAGQGGGDASETIDISKAALDKLAAVYGRERSELSKLRNVSELVLPLTVSTALEKGRIVRHVSDLQEVHAVVGEFLDSRHAYWPIVKTVTITGQFPILKGGAKLVDLPGTNDSNEAREQVTHQYLKASRFVWIVFSMKRALTRDIKDILHSRDFIRRVIMDGRENAMTLIGTHADEFDLDSAAEELGLECDCSAVEVMESRNRSVQESIVGDLRELAATLEDVAAGPRFVGEMMEPLLRSRVYTVSSLDYLSVIRQSRSMPRVVHTPEQTQIPALQRHIKQLCDGFGVEAQARAHHRRMDNLLTRIAKEYLEVKDALERQKALSAKKRKEAKEAIYRLAAFLVGSIQDCRKGFVQDVSASQEVFSERLRSSFMKGRMNLDHACARWSAIHWATLKAVARRQGRFPHSRSGPYDFPEEVAKPILDSIATAWSEFFGKQLVHTVELWTERLLGLAAQHGRDMLNEAASVYQGAGAELHRNLIRVVNMAERIVRERFEQTRSEINRKLEEARRDLYETIPGHIHASMKDGFDRAAREHGTGMKGRIVGILEDHAHAASEDMFQDAEDRLMDEVRCLKDWLTTKFKELGDAVERQYQTYRDNLAEEDNMPTEEVERQLAEMIHSEELLAELREAPELHIDCEVMPLADSQ